MNSGEQAVKITVSADWTQEERLQLVQTISGQMLLEQDPAKKNNASWWRMKTLEIYHLTTQAAHFLEANRLNYREYLAD